MSKHREVFATLAGNSQDDFEIYVVEMRKVGKWGTYVGIDAAAKMSEHHFEVFSDSNNNIDLAHINVNDYLPTTLFLVNYQGLHFLSLFSSAVHRNWQKETETIVCRCCSQRSRLWLCRSII